MKKSLLSVILLSFVISLAPATLYAQTEDTTPVPYEEEEFPQWMLDVRRFEIISVGSLPFTMLGTSLVYSGVMVATGQLASFPNPFDKTAPQLTINDQLAVLGIAACISIGISLTDLIITLVKRNSAKKALEQEEAQTGQVIITPQEAGNLLRKNTEDE